MKRFVYRLEVALRGAELAERTAASAFAGARADLAACESEAAAAARPRRDVDPSFISPRTACDLEYQADRAIHADRARLAAVVRARANVDSARAAYARATQQRNVFERHRRRLSARAYAAGVVRDERERDEFETRRRAA